MYYKSPLLEATDQLEHSVLKKIVLNLLSQPDISDAVFSEVSKVINAEIENKEEWLKKCSIHLAEAQKQGDKGYIGFWSGSIRRYKMRKKTLKESLRIMKVYRQKL